jgi:hypothetical protein
MFPAIPKDIPRWLYEAFRKLQQTQVQTSAGLAAVGRGESPDGSGLPLAVDLSKYFYLPGRIDGQTGYGSIASAGNLQLSSTAHATKGFIYLGEPTVRAALDETQGFLGIGTSTPAARLHLKFATPGTTTVGAIGQTLLLTTVGSNDTMTWSEFQNNSSQYDVAILSGGLAAARGIYFTDFNLTTGFRFAYGLLGAGAVQYAHFQTGGLASTGFSKNNNLLLTGMNDNMGTSFLADFRRGSFNTRVGTGEANFTTRANNGMYAFNLNADDYQSSGDADTCSVLIGQKVTAAATYRVALVIEQPATTVNSFEVRTTAGGSVPAKTLGAPLLAIGPGLGSLTNEAALIGYSSGTESMRLSPLASAALQWGFLSPAGLTQIAHANTAGWADSVANSTRIELGDLHASTHRAACLTSAGGNRFTRLGVSVIDGVTIGNAFLGGGATAIELPVSLLYIVNNATNGADAKALLTLTSKRSGQSGKYFDIVNSAAASLFQVVAGGATTIQSTTGTALTVKPPSGLFATIDSTFTDTAFPETGTSALTTGIWTLAPTFSNGGLGVGTSVAFAITPTMNDLLDANAVGLNMTLAANHTAGDSTTAVNGLRFVISTAAAGSGATWTSLTGASGNASHLSSDPITTVTGVGVTVIAGAAGAAAGLTGEMRGFNVATVVNHASTTITLWNGLRIANPSGAGVITTAVGLRIETITKGVTSWALQSAGGKSYHVGNFSLGGTATPTAKVHIAAGTTAASTAPIKLTSGTVMTTAEAGAIEFTTDDVFFTITTGAARKAFVLDDGTRLTTGRVPFATTNGRLTDDADLTFVTDTLTVTKLGSTELTGTLTATGRLVVPMGEISYFDTTGTAVTITTVSDGSTNMVVVPPATALSSGAYQFDNGGSDNGRLRYTGATTKMFHVACTLSIAPAAANDTFVLGIAKGGTVIATSKVLQRVLAAADTQFSALHVMVELATNEYLELYVGNITDADDLTVKSLNLFAAGF